MDLDKMTLAEPNAHRHVLTTARLNGLISALQSSFIDTISDVKEHPIAVEGGHRPDGHDIAPRPARHCVRILERLAGSIAYLILRRYNRPTLHTRLSVRGTEAVSRRAGWFRSFLQCPAGKVHGQARFGVGQVQP
ncbi:hypothetical protein GCM10027562_24870 [Arthrobacter pigmenti]